MGLAQDILIALKQPRTGQGDSAVADTDFTILTVSTQEPRKFYAEKIIITNLESADLVVQFWDGPSASAVKKGKLIITATASEAFDLASDSLFSGMLFETSVVARVDAFTTGSTIIITGYEL